MTVLSSAIKSISDYSDAIISKIIYHAGLWVGIGGGAATYSVGKAVQQTQMSPMAAFVLEWGGLISMIAAASLIIKNIVDTWLSIKKAKMEQEAHQKEMGE